MKKLMLILAMSFFMVGMVACDIIEEPYFKENNEDSEHLPLSDEDILNWQNKKVVLLEDFTGVKCVNCPQAAALAHDLQEQYEHQLVVLGVHASSGDAYTSPVGGFPDFRTEEGTEWYAHFKFAANPIGTINRQNNCYGYLSSQWADVVSETVNGTPNIRLLSAVKYNEDDRELKVSVYSKFLEEFSDKYSLTVCIMEDSIVGKQIGQGDSYVHRHVFRKCMNGTWGAELNTEVIAPEEEIIKSYSLTLDEAYNADQCYIVAYVSNSESKEVLQVTEKKIK